MTPDSFPDHLDSADLQADEPLAHPARGSAPNHSRTKQWVAAAAVAGALLGTTGIAMAQTNDGAASDSTTGTEQTTPDGVPTGDQQAPPDQVDRSQAVHPGEELLTGDTADNVKAAAEAAVPDATVDRVETDAEGSPYEAHMTRSDGTHVTVKVDESFSVTTVETDQGPAQGGRPGGPQGEAPATGSTGSDASA